MDILVISGFLGAGQTTFIKEIIKKTKRDYCILENEYGAINIDSSTLKEETKNNDVKIYELTEGCICCSSKGEFASSILTISNTIDPDYLIIEPTGVGYLSSILNNLRKVRYERIHILNAVTIVDGIYLFNSLNNDKLDECLLDQIKNASIIVVSKQENLSSEDKQLVKNKLHHLNSLASIIIAEHYSTLGDDFFKSLFLNRLDEDKIEQREIKAPPFTNFALKEYINLKNPIELISILEDVSRGLYGGIYRAKGFVKLPNQILHFEFTNGLYTIEEYSGEEVDNEVVFIGYTIDKTNLRNRFIKIE